MTWLQTYLQKLTVWEMVGWIGQVLFFGRFFVQWIVSEKQKRSVIPFHFWTLSIGGSILLLAYAVHVFMTKGENMPIIVGQAMGIFIYTRNMMLLKQKGLRPNG